MYIYEIKITQSDCPHIDVTNEFRDVYILVMNTMEEMETQKMFSVVYSRSQEDLTSALKLLDSHRLVNELELISRRPNVAAIFYEMQETSMYRRTAREGFRIHPMVAHRGDGEVVRGLQEGQVR
ncbi:hypothetical protein [Thermogymnomonas acidicola]|uniref:hypothetical protein n=1 Tax=Thermogymnomonas acidicola TaxID=399579 RepID=UPI00094679F8|nr:hypothetical protein [Thermogymnomonas acidicola]